MQKSELLQKSTPSQRRVVIAAVFGNMLEFYDFVVYSYFAIIIGKQFFSNHDPGVSTILAFLVFAGGFIIRPLGGVVLGYYADRKGRRSALTLSIMLMALGSAMIGLSPTYAQIGFAAPLIITLARIIQGFAAGGEVGAATATLLETGVAHRRGFRSAWQLASQGAASLLGALIAMLLHFSLSAEAMNEWGWRVPFLLGTLIVPVGIYIRRHLTDEPAKVPAKAHYLFQPRYIRNWLLIVFIVQGASVSTYILIYYVPIYGIQQLGLSEKLSTLISVTSSFLMMVLSPLYGLWSDHLRRRKLPMLIGFGMVILLLYPAFWVMTQFIGVSTMIAVMILLMIFFMMGSAPSYALMTESFPRHIRATYMATAYAVGVSVFGGTSQLIVAWLLEVTSNKMVPALYMMVSLSVAFIAVCFLKETADKPLEEMAQETRDGLPEITR